ncbi:Basic leucine zipper [Thalictrum thalictroides]|uniref:Basic leucine zipper n=1 Tax=Thalictrum thalictroides TaxID=46969 RepID=A0A7J6WLS0_THATH|nr:Basic leucine zipper [Thalictrum thalictroides]
MQPGEISGLRYQAPADQQYLGHFSAMQNNMSTLHINEFLRPITHYQISPPFNEFPPQSSCFSNTSTSDEAEEQHLSIIDERKQRRMISNRESARRSRMRKQKHLDELWSQVVRLRSENRQLIDKLNHVSESHNRAVQENTRLKDEASEIRKMLSNLQIDNTYNTLRD